MKNRFSAKFGIFILIAVLSILLFNSIIGYSVLNESDQTDRVYLSEGRSFLEIDPDGLRINRTLDLNGTSIEINYNNESGYLYGTVGATDKLYKIDPHTFSKVDVFNGHSHNVQDVMFDTSNGYIYTTSSDNTVRKLNSESLNQVGIYRGHERSVMVGRLVKDENTIYTGSFDYSLVKINSTDMSERARIDGFPERLVNVAYDEDSNTAYYGGSLGGIYALDKQDFYKYDNYDQIPTGKINNIEYNGSSDDIDKSSFDLSTIGIFKTELDVDNGYLYAGGANGMVYKIDTDDLKVINSYSVQKNRDLEYDFTNYDSPSIRNGTHIYNYDVRGIEMTDDSEFIYVSTAPGAIIKIDTESMNEVSRLNTQPGSRTVSLSVVHDLRR